MNLASADVLRHAARHFGRFSGFTAARFKTGWAATAPGAPLERHSYDPGPLGAEEVEVAVEYCGICHSDQSMIDNEWGNARYPFIPGHEVVGTIVRVGEQARGLKLGQRVGIGWYKGSCMHCGSCMEGSHNLCRTVKPTIVGSHGGFADRLRAHWAWAVPLPAGLDPALVGPLFCAGSTVFSPLLEFDIKPTDRVGVVGIGGLGHLALRFLNAWGCEVTAFTSSLSKQAEAMSLGAHKVVASTDSKALKAIAGTLDFLLVTASADLDWNAMLATLRGKLADVAWEKALLSGAIKETCTVHGMKMPQVAIPLRVALLGQPQTPSIDAVLETMGVVGAGLHADDEYIELAAERRSDPAEDEEGEPVQEETASPCVEVTFSRTKKEFDLLFKEVFSPLAEDTEELLKDLKEAEQEIRQKWEESPKATSEKKE